MRPRHRPTKRGARRLGRWLRGRRIDRNPLRRGSDRAQTAMLGLLLAAFLAGALGELGLGRGDRVAVAGRNCHRYLELYQAVPGAGMVIVPLLRMR